MNRVHYEQSVCSPVDLNKHLSITTLKLIDAVYLAMLFKRLLNHEKRIGKTMK